MFLITSIDTHEITSQIVVHDVIENEREEMDCIRSQKQTFNKIRIL